MQVVPAPLASTAGLRKIKLLSGVAEDALRTLSTQCAWRRFEPDECIVSRDARGDDVYLIVSGVVRVTAFSRAGRQVTFRDLGEGEWFGDLAALDGHPRSADVLAVAPTLLARLSAEVFVALATQTPAVAEALLRHLVGWIRDLTERLFELSTVGVQNRVHAELLRLARQAGVRDNVAAIAPVPRHSDIASQVSTYREQVTRELSGLAKQGLIARHGRTLVVLDVQRLQSLVAAARRTS